MEYTYVCSKYHRHKEECALHTVKSCTCRKLLGSNIETQADRKAFVAHLTAKQSGQMKRELMTKQKNGSDKKWLTESVNLMASHFYK